MAILWTEASRLGDTSGNQDWAVAEFDSVEIRALALDRYSQWDSDIAEWTRCDPETLAEQLLQPQALVIICRGDAELITEYGMSSTRHARVEIGSLRNPVCSAILVNAERLINRAKLFGVGNAREWFDNQRRSSVLRQERVLREATQHWGESDVP
jgi:hypothetical protein